MFKKPTILWLVVLAVGLGLIIFFFASREAGEISDSENKGNGDLTQKSSEPTASDIITPQPSESQFPNIVNKYPPAECSLAGSIEYLEPRLYENRGANINYKNVDSNARHIIWSVSPKDDLSVGPNLFSRLPLPDGSEDITASLPVNPIAKNYILTAQITYGVFVKGNQEIRTVSCVGQIPVEIKY